MEPGEDETKRDCWTVAFGNLEFILFSDIEQFFSISIRELEANAV